MLLKIIYEETDCPFYLYIFIEIPIYKQFVYDESPQ